MWRATSRRLSAAKEMPLQQPTNAQFPADKYPKFAKAPTNRPQLAGSANRCPQFVLSGQLSKESVEKRPVFVAEILAPEGTPVGKSYGPASTPIGEF